LNKYIKLDDRFSIGVDSFNVILKDKNKHTNKGYTYHASLSQVVSEIFTKLEKDSIEVGESDLDKYLAHSSDLCSSIDALSKDISLLIEKKLKKLKKDLQ